MSQLFDGAFFNARNEAPKRNSGERSGSFRPTYELEPEAELRRRYGIASSDKVELVPLGYRQIGQEAGSINSTLDGTVLILTSDPKVRKTLMGAAFFTGFTVCVCNNVSEMFKTPGRIAFLDPDDLSQDDWILLHRAYNYAGPDQLPCYLLRPLPMGQRLPRFAQLLSGPPYRDSWGRNLSTLLESLHDVPCLIADLVPFIPSCLEIEKSEFYGMDIVATLAQAQPEKYLRAVSLITYLERPLLDRGAAELCVDRLLVAHLYRLGDLVEKVSQDTSTFVLPRGELFALWRKTERKTEKSNL